MAFWRQMKHTQFSRPPDRGGNHEHDFGQGAAAPGGDASRPLPEFVRIPKNGARCPVSGLSRSSMIGLISGSSPPVRSVVLRQQGATRGIRLVNTQSLVSYLHGLEN